MKGLLEGVGVIALFILTPVIVVWVLIAVAQVIASLGGSREATLSPVTCCGRLSLGRGNTSWCAAVSVSQTKRRNVIIPNGHNTQPWHELGAVAVLWAEPT